MKISPAGIGIVSSVTSSIDSYSYSWAWDLSRQSVGNYNNLGYANKGPTNALALTTGEQPATGGYSLNTAFPFIQVNQSHSGATNRAYDQVYSVDKVSSGWKVSRTNNILHETPDDEGTYRQYGYKELIEIRYTGDINSDAFSPRIENDSSNQQNTDKIPGGMISEANKYFTIVTTFSKDRPLPLDFDLVIMSRLRSAHPDFNGTTNGNTTVGTEGTIVNQVGYDIAAPLSIYDSIWGPHAGESEDLEYSYSNTRWLKPSHINGIPLYDENGNLYPRHEGSRNPRSGLSSRDKGKIVSITWDLSRMSGGGYDGKPERKIGGYLNPTNGTSAGRGNTSISGEHYSHVEDPVFGYGGDGFWNSNFYDGTQGGPVNHQARRHFGRFFPRLRLEDPGTGLEYPNSAGYGLDLSHRYSANVAAPYGSGDGISVSGGMPFLSNTLFTSVNRFGLCTMRNYGPGDTIEKWIDPDNPVSGGHPVYGVGATATSNSLNCEFILHGMMIGPEPPSIRTLPIVYNPGGGIGAGAGSFKSSSVSTDNNSSGGVVDFQIPKVVHVNALSYYTSRKNSDGNFYGIQFPEDYIAEGLEGTSKDPFAELRQNGTGSGPIDYTDGPIFIIFEIPEGMNIGANTSGNFGSQTLGGSGTFSGAKYELRKDWDPSWSGSDSFGQYLSDPSLIINLNSNHFHNSSLGDLHITIVNRGNTIGAGGSGGYGGSDSTTGCSVKNHGGGGGGGGQGLHPTWGSSIKFGSLDNFAGGAWVAGQGGEKWTGASDGAQGTLNGGGAGGAKAGSGASGGGGINGHAGGSAIYVKSNSQFSNTQTVNINVVNMPTGRMYGGGGGGGGGLSSAGGAGGNMTTGGSSNFGSDGTNDASGHVAYKGGWQGNIVWADTANVIINTTVTNHNSDYAVAGWDGVWT